MGFLAPSAPAMPPIPQAPPPVVGFGSQPQGTKPPFKGGGSAGGQATMIAGNMFPAMGQTAPTSLLGTSGTTGGRSSLLGVG